VKQRPITCHHPLRHRPSVVWRGSVDFSTSVPPHPCKSPASAALGAAGLARLLAKHDDATRSSRHVCHAPTLSAAKKRRLGSGASAAVVLQAEGAEACPVALCIHAERHGMRSFLSPKSLVGDREPRSTRPFHPAGLFIQVQLQLPPPPYDHVLFLRPYSHFPAYLPQLPPSVNTLA
jgi:hypothetical protein